ncbi:hypothetical protein L6270_03345 [Candidatus Parcubacteria bacterium]|nr:hypothetical protein [Patescibacteria group bacterium]MBU4309000.1 hypothetical protein [Patescibacteria group bacterium]MBU4432406.1 hypothetical protein [Patescibacteria group bacterium]MBU4577360.1 hypothetical protein [Patescibacteria group bacterium]MCG2697048.1 hypothetical protein [Candidatus Parcubacteria bacterium]
MVTCEGDMVAVSREIFAEAVQLATNLLCNYWKSKKRFAEVVIQVQNEIGDKYEDVLTVGQIENLEEAVIFARQTHCDFIADQVKKLKYVKNEIRRLTPGLKLPSSKVFLPGSIHFEDGEVVNEQLLRRALKEVLEERVEIFNDFLNDKKRFENFVRKEVRIDYPGDTFLDPNFSKKQLVYQGRCVPKGRVTYIVQKLINERKRMRKGKELLCSERVFDLAS